MGVNVQNNNRIVENDRSFVNQFRKALPPARSIPHALVEYPVQHALEQMFRALAAIFIGDHLHWLAICDVDHKAVRARHIYF